MPRYQLRRPSPIIIVPRQQPSATGAPSPDSPDSSPGSPDSPDTPPGSKSPASPTSTSFSQSTQPATLTAIESSSIVAIAQPVVTSISTTALPASPSSIVPPESPSSTALPPSISTTIIVVSSSTAVLPPSPSQAIGGSAVQNLPVSQPTQTATSTRTIVIPTGPKSPERGAAPSGLRSPSRENASESSTRVSSGPSILQTETVGSPKPKADGSLTLPEKQAQHNARSMSMGAEAALITCSILGAIALVVGIIIMLKRRRRRTQANLRHNPSSFDPSNTGSLQAPETVHISSSSTPGSHFSNATRTESIFAAGAYERPETVSTDHNRSRLATQPIGAPQPTPNPFADPGLNKAYDVLRGRPRSTTLTDRGSWIENPFKDPSSERFDPFGELKEKARMERIKYMQDIRREEEMRRREEEMREKERMGLGPPPRKGSGVTIEGVGVLDRSGSR